MSRSDGRITALDGVRTIAVMAVLFAHTGWYLATGGYLGVDIFFVLSGFLITRLLLAEFAENGRIALGRFYLRRALRLYPALIMAVIVAGVAGTHLYPSPASFLRAAGVSITYLMDVARAAGFQSQTEAGSLGITWSLAVEEHFYLLWPVALVAIFAWSRSRRSVFVASSALAVVCWLSLLMASASGISGESLYFQPQFRGAALFVGCAVGSLPDNVRIRTPGAIAAVSGVGLLVLLQLGGEQTNLASYGLRMPATWLLTAVLLVALVTQSSSLAARGLSWGPMTYTGRISYGIYLYHYPIIVLLTHSQLRFAIRMPLNVLLPFAAAAVSYHMLERPILRLSHRKAQRSIEVGTSQPVIGS